MRDEVQTWRELRSVRLSLLWYSVARRKQQENSLQQVKSARASPLAFSPIASQPCERRVSRCYGTRSRDANSRRNTHRQVGSARASPLAFSLIASRPRRFHPSLHRRLLRVKMSRGGHHLRFCGNGLDCFAKEAAVQTENYLGR